MSEFVDNLVNWQYLVISSQAGIEMATYSPRHNVVLVLVKHLTADVIQMSSDELSQSGGHPVAQLNTLKAVGAPGAVNDIQHVE